MKKNILSVIFILIIISCVIGSFFIKKTEEYTKNIYYMDTYINIKIYSSNENKVNEAFAKIEEIYSQYHELSDRYNEYDDITNLYSILHNKSNDEYLKLDSKLYNMIEYGLNWYEKSDGKIDICLGNVTDIWKNYRDVGSGIPSLEELNIANLNTVKSIELKDDNLIRNNHPNIDLDSIPVSFATEEASEYLDSIGLNKYVINAGGDVKLGKHYNNEKYSIGLEDSNDGQSIYRIVYGENISIATSGKYSTYYEYNGEKYSDIIDPNTLYPGTNFKSVTVICDNFKTGIMISNTLYSLTIDEGKKYISSFDGVEAIWNTNNDEIITTDNFYKYENK